MTQRQSLPSLPPYALPQAPPHAPSGTALRAVVAIPAHDEADCIRDCLQALAAQRDAAGAPLPPGLFGVVVLANNCRDSTAALARDMAPALPYPLLVLDVTLEPEFASAGWARRLGMEAGADWIERCHDGAACPAGVILTTDADGRPDPLWIANNLAAIDAGADGVCGAITVDEAEHRQVLPLAVRERGAEEERYAALLDEMAARLDPDPADPWPRHDNEPGASLAVTLDAYRGIGGLPPLRLGEDRALCTALRRIDARLRHAPNVSVEVSCRLEGRARGGMADTMRHRIAVAEAPLDGKLEPARDAWRRNRVRATLRQAWRTSVHAGLPADAALLQSCAARLGLAAPALATLLDRPHFGASWEAIEAASPVLSQRRIVAPAALRLETLKAESMVTALRCRESRPTLLAAD